ncbi:hypothetical protein [Sutcliffiella rhizosphaerae]|uniref:Uncharacterized protein n=1 Tax=Sutcliffiella rhizosphaerae TaxID=2880967 RepID=A0ABM8YIQ5_9BACI|nr:hypothetical protein [Sutcliffiella rhizosphaerae]CAG9619769.1 hypothetical protein BACCIP111883_00537 [Sutcliffiella rhizosphaerae]
MEKYNEDQGAPSFSSIRLDVDEKEQIYERLTDSMNRNTKKSLFTFQIIFMYASVLLIASIIISGTVIKLQERTVGTLSEHGIFEEPNIPILQDLDLHLQQEMENKWWIKDEKEKVVGAIIFAEEPLQDSIEITAIIENKELSDYAYPTIYILEHVKTMGVFQSHHYFINREGNQEGPSNVYLRINVPYPDHVLEKQATFIMESYQKHN